MTRITQDGVQQTNLKKDLGRIIETTIPFPRVSGLLTYTDDARTKLNPPQQLPPYPPPWHGH
jgi:hypothetical protein